MLSVTPIYDTDRALHDVPRHAKVLGQTGLDLFEHERVVAHLAQLHERVVQRLGAAVLLLRSCERASKRT